MSDVKLIEGTVLKLNKNSKYLLLFDRHTVTPFTVRELNQILTDEGFYCITAIIDGDPSKVKILEETK